MGCAFTSSHSPKAQEDRRGQWLKVRLETADQPVEGSSDIWRSTSSPLKLRSEFWLIPRSCEASCSLEQLGVSLRVLFLEPQQGIHAIRGRFDDALHFVLADPRVKVFNWPVSNRRRNDGLRFFRQSRLLSCDFVSYVLCCELPHARRIVHGWNYRHNLARGEALKTSLTTAPAPHDHACGSCTEDARLRSTTEGTTHSPAAAHTSRGSADCRV